MATVRGTVVERIGRTARRVAAALVVTLLAGGLAVGVAGAATNSRPFTETTAEFMKACFRGGGDVSNAINAAGDVTVSCTRADKSVETCNFTNKTCTTTPPPRRISDFGVAAPGGVGTLDGGTGGEAPESQTGPRAAGGWTLATADEQQ